MPRSELCAIALAIVTVCVAPTTLAHPTQAPGATAPNSNSLEGTDAQDDPQSLQPTGALVRGGGAPISWTYPRFSLANGAFVVGSVATTIGALIVGPDTENPRRGGVWIDDDVRDALRISSDVGRQRARDVSDLLLTFTTSYPYLADAMITAAWYRDSPDLGVQLALIDLEVHTATIAAQTFVNMITSRERPFGSDCGVALDAQTDDCATNNRYRSHYSGHASIAFASASVTCVHHAYIPLHGGGFPDAVPCIGGYALAATTAALRVVADQHYFTDVAVGALSGTVIGLGLPWLFHYRHGSPQAVPPSRGLSIQVVPTASGVRAVGTF